jgi:hypothetical protein
MTKHFLNLYLTPLTMCINVYPCVSGPFLLRGVIQRPASAPDAWDMGNFYREEAGCQRCCFELDMWHRLERHLKSSRFEAKRTFDAVLAITLISNTVDVFYTRNTRDFKGLGFRSIVNPID